MGIFRVSGFLQPLNDGGTQSENDRVCVADNFQLRDGNVCDLASFEVEAGFVEFGRPLLILERQAILCLPWTAPGGFAVLSPYIRLKWQPP